MKLIVVSSLCVGLAVLCSADGGYPQHMLPSMAYTLSNPAKGYEGKSQQFTSNEFFEAPLRIPLICQLTTPPSFLGLRDSWPFCHRWIHPR